MPFEYNNSSAPYYSEAQRQWSVGQDWTKGGTASLIVWFYGDAANTAEQLYVVLEDSTGHIRIVSYSDPAAVKTASWQQWTIPLTSFTGVNTAGIKKMYIGVGNRITPVAGSTGKLYIDDIRLSR